MRPEKPPEFFQSRSVRRSARDDLTQSLANLVVVPASARRIGAETKTKPRDESGPTHRHFHPLLRPSAENNLSEKFVVVVPRHNPILASRAPSRKPFLYKSLSKARYSRSECASVSLVDLQILSQVKSVFAQFATNADAEEFADTLLTFLGKINKRDRPICGQ